MSFASHASGFRISCSGYASRMSDSENAVPDELEEQLDNLAEDLQDPNRGDRTIQDQGVEGKIVGGDGRDDDAVDSND